MFKKRKMKKSERGIYIQDKELIDSLFKIGESFKYIIDKDNKKIVIVPTNTKTNNTVSKRKIKGIEKPVLDIRNKDALSVFDDYAYLQLSITDNKILVEGYNNANENVQVSQLVNKNIRNVISINDLINVKKENEIKVSKNYVINNCSRAAGSQSSLSSISSVVRKIKNITKDALKSMQLPLTVCSLFSGAGIMDSAFMDDFEIVFALEMDKDACETYRYNISDNILQGDIQEHGNKIPHATVMIAGTPCQGFSSSNRHDNYLDNPKNLLVREYIKAVKNTSPSVFVLENVPQILTVGNGKFLKEICNELSDYEITSQVLNATDFGAAQKRKRAVIIGSKIGRIEILKPVIKIENTVRNVFKKLTIQTPNQLDYSKPKELTLKRIKSVPPGGNVFDIPPDIRPKGVHSDVYKRLLWDEPSVTIVNCRKAMILHPEEDRILSVREAARLQGIADDFIFKGKLNSKQQQISNAICVNAFKLISKTIKIAIERYKKNNLAALPI